MKIINVLVVALALTFLSLAPAAAQEAPSALEFAVGQSAQPATIAPVCRSRRCRAAAAAQSRPMDIRTAPQMVAYAAQFVGTRNPYRFRGPGCKVFVNMVARRSGYYANSSARAIDVARMGTRVSYPQPGDYRYSGRRGDGHAEIVASVEGGRVVTINGNKGGNRVGYSYRSIGSGVYYRPIRYAGL